MARCHVAAIVDQSIRISLYIIVSSISEQAARLLLDAHRRRHRIDELPVSCRPLDLASGYAIQDTLLASTGEHLAGYKIAATSEAGQAHIGVDHPIAGGLVASHLSEPGACVSLVGNQMCAVEGEFVFEFERPLMPKPTPYSRDQVMQAVGSLRLGIEVPDSRLNNFARAGAPQLVADNACAHRFILGPAIACEWRADNLAEQVVELWIDGREVARGVGANALGDPRDALVWLVNHCSSRDQALGSGQFVTTGVCAGPTEVSPGQAVVARFGRYGEVDMTLSSDV